MSIKVQKNNLTIFRVQKEIKTKERWDLFNA